MDIFMLIMPTVNVLLWLLAAASAYRNGEEGWNGRLDARQAYYAEAGRQYGAGRLNVQQLLLADAVATVLVRTGLQERLQLQLAALHGRLAVLKGREWRIGDTERYAAYAIGGGWACWTCGAAFAALAKEPGILLLSAVIGLLLPVMKLREPSRLAERRRQNIVLSLPDMLGKLMLLVGAGETVHRAVARCWSGQALETESSASGGLKRRRERKAPDLPLHEEWGRMVRALENGESFTATVESFSRRCAVQEVSMFATVMLLHYRKGGDQFALALRELSYSLWEKRKATARMRGEEASSKLVFPLAAIFGLLMIAVAAPALLMMP